MIFLPKQYIPRKNLQWTGKILFVQASVDTKLALNSKEISSLHLVVNRYDHWQNAVNLFHSHVGLSHVQLIRKLSRNEDICSSIDELPVCNMRLFKCVKS